MKRLLLTLGTILLITGCSKEPTALEKCVTTNKPIIQQIIVDKWDEWKVTTMMPYGDEFGNKSCKGITLKHSDKSISCLGTVIDIFLEFEDGYKLIGFPDNTAPKLNKYGQMLASSLNEFLTEPTTIVEYSRSMKFRLYGIYPLEMYNIYNQLNPSVYDTALKMKDEERQIYSNKHTNKYVLSLPSYRTPVSNTYTIQPNKNIPVLEYFATQHCNSQGIY